MANIPGRIEAERSFCTPDCLERMKADIVVVLPAAYWLKRRVNARKIIHILEHAVLRKANRANRYMGDQHSLWSFERVTAKSVA